MMKAGRWLLLATATAAAVLQEDVWSEQEAWTELAVSPPPSSCWADWISDAVCNPLGEAVKKAVPFTRITVGAGEYRNKGWGAGGLHNKWLVEIKKKTDLQIVGASGVATPRLRFDGSGGISIKDSHNVTIQGLEIEGPAARISGSEASQERARLTSRALDGSTTRKCSSDECASCLADECTSELCEYDSKNNFCKGKTLGYFNGRGIAVWAGSGGSSRISLTGLKVHHCPASGIRANKGDEVQISDNIVYDNIWWTTSGESAIVFAESAGTGTNRISGNVVYGNRNFIPFYSPSLTDLPGQTGSKIGHYASWNQDYIIDGSGVYISRNQEYQGTFILEDNVAFDNGINGMVVHNTNNPKVSVIVMNNTIFSNGRTTTDIEKRQSAGGFTINSGNNVHLEANSVATSSENTGDFAFQCFNTCNIIGGSNNQACKPTNVNKAFAAYVTQTDSCRIAQAAIKAQFPASTMPHAPQYTKWCVQCGNKRTDYMKKNNVWCGDFIDNNKNQQVCRESDYWISQKFCSKSCYERGVGYDNEQCCST